MTGARDTQDRNPDEARRRILIGASALGLSSLLLGGCASRAPAPRKQPAPVRPAPSSPLVTATPVPALKPGARVAIVAPASTTLEAADEAAQWLESRGYVAQVMPASRTRLESPFDYLAGTDAQRLNDLQAAFTSPDIGAVWCLQGGFGSWRLLDDLDYGLLRKHPKPFIGYSDITALHLALQRNAGFVTFHGPMLGQDFLVGRREPSESQLFAMIGGQMGSGAWIDPPLDARPTELIRGTATGRLVGGNLALIASLIGTPYDIDTRDAILFFEDVNEAVPRIDRMLNQLAAAGKFDEVKGVLVGKFTRVLGLPLDDTEAQGMLYPLIMDQFRGRGIPVLGAWPSGHGDPNLTLPLGARVTLDTQRGALRLEQAITV